MTRRRWKWAGLVAALAVIVVVIDCTFQSLWTGDTEFTVEFAATDAETGKPIPGAKVEVEATSPFFYDEPLSDAEGGKKFEQVEFTLTTDAEGVARRVCGKNVVIGRSSSLGIMDTHTVYLPHWRYRVLADGYQPTEWGLLDSHKSRRDAKRNGPGKALLRVPVQLHKSGGLP